MMNFSSRLIGSFIKNWKKGIIKLSNKAAVFFLKFSLFLVAISVLSLFSIVLLRNHLLPTGELINKKVFFDYDEIRPIAKIHLFSKHDQWDNLQTSGYYDAQSKGSIKPFLKSGTTYKIGAVFYLSRSDKNYKFGKFMTTLSVIDAAGELVAKSKRPIVMPYQSPLAFIIGTLTRLVIYSQPDTAVVSISLMDNYLEQDGAPATELLEFELSTNSFDVEEVRVSVVPSVRGIEYPLHYYPTVSTIVGIFILFSVQLLLGLFALGVSYLLYGTIPISASTWEEDDEEEEREEETEVAQAIGGNNAYGSGWGTSSYDRRRARLWQSVSSDNGVDRRGGDNEGNIVDDDDADRSYINNDSNSNSENHSGTNRVGSRRSGSGDDTSDEEDWSPTTSSDNPYNPYSIDEGTPPIIGSMGMRNRK
jgi:hypothetical protein